MTSNKKYTAALDIVRPPHHIASIAAPHSAVGEHTEQIMAGKNKGNKAAGDTTAANGASAPDNGGIVFETFEGLDSIPTVQKSSEWNQYVDKVMQAPSVKGKDGKLIAPVCILFRGAITDEKTPYIRAKSFKSAAQRLGKLDLMEVATRANGNERLVLAQRKAVEPEEAAE